MSRRLLALFLGFASFSFALEAWEIGPFERVDEVNPVIAPRKDTVFSCPVQLQDVCWESDHTFNPAAVVRDGVLHLFYRAEDDSGVGIGKHTSRLGLATSTDGLHFVRQCTPVLYPDVDKQLPYEWPGGCEDPRIVEAEDGTYVMTYTQWNRSVAVLGVATSDDLLHWEKHGYVFQQSGVGRRWSKSGAIVCKQEGDRLIAEKIHGKYWMYWGEGSIYIATSENLINWTPLTDEKGNLIPLFNARPGMFDSALVEPGPPAVISSEGIVFLYNGKNDGACGDPSLPSGAYSAGQALIDSNNPQRVIARRQAPFLKPEKPYETSGQYAGGTVFIEGLVPFHGQWFLYYGAADSAIGVAVAPREGAY